MSELEEDSGIGEITQTQDEAALEGEERPLQPQEPQEAQEPEEPQAYEGTYQHGRYHGKGKLRHSDSTYYEGTFANGLFHGEGRLYVKGGFFEGFWERGRLVDGGFIFEDGLQYKPVTPGANNLASEYENQEGEGSAGEGGESEGKRDKGEQGEEWAYCSATDPRFHSEIRDGIQLGAELRDSVPHDFEHLLPMKCYDTIDGFYDPHKHAVFAYDHSAEGGAGSLPLRVPPADEIEWLMRVARVGKGENMSYS